MSNMSELSIAAATTRHEGSTALDDLAHELAHTVALYVDRGASYETMCLLANRFGDASFVVVESSRRGCSFEQLPMVIANEYLSLHAEVSDTYKKQAELLRDWKRAQRGIEVLGC
ncbi:MAG: hypothetical protein ACO3VH_07175 [Ilumatobacteraceae bacterium]